MNPISNPTLIYNYVAAVGDCDPIDITITLVDGELETIGDIDACETFTSAPPSTLSKFF
jgi:hypothetical protein